MLPDSQSTEVRPQTLLLTFLGRAVLGHDIAVFSGTYLTVMDRLGVSEQATRSTLSRMVSRQLLTRHRRGRKMYFGLTAQAEAVLTEGAQRLWKVGAVNRDADEHWTLLGFSLPESRRDERHLLRSRLRWAGFGPLRSGLWIAPGTVDVTELLPEQVREHVHVFHARAAEPAAIDQMMRDAYDLPAIAARYQRFLDHWGARRPHPAAGDDLTRQLWLVSEWLLILRDDPRIPVRHLPRDWPAEAAEALFHRCHERLSGPAQQILDEILDAVEIQEP
ncbi:PaaX family transcriptional regulator [Phytohabitans houttuyneae]|uniref:PaaX family transcriptional regulator n=1 Tax=Phytohabitans houttuyneae TaxID=1076126 RepID=UPI0015636297|nr:PaaX family transcriptional regulator C-terminal domain-containing protein [Phytohabitans houttuyneae]